MIILGNKIKEQNLKIKELNFSISEKPHLI